MPVHLSPEEVANRRALGRALRAARLEAGATRRAVAAVLGTTRLADITDFEIGATRRITDRVIRAYEIATGLDLGHLDGEPPTPVRQLDSLVVVANDITVFTDPGGRIRQTRLRLVVRALSDDVQAFRLLEHLPGTSIDKVLDLQGGKLGTLLPKADDLRTYGVMLPQPLDAGETHEVLLEFVGASDENLVVFPVDGQALHLSAWFPPPAKFSAWQIGGIKPGAPATAATERAPVSVSRNGYCRVELANPRRSSGVGLAWEVADGPPDDLTDDDVRTVHALPQPDQGQLLRRRRQEALLTLVDMQRLIGLRSSAMLSRIENGHKPAPERIVRSYLQAGHPARQPTPVGGVTATEESTQLLKVHWDVAVGRFGVALHQELAFRALVPGVDRLLLGEELDDDMDVARPLMEDLDGGALHVETVGQRNQLFCRFEPLLTGEVHRVRHSAVPLRPDVALRAAKGEATMTIAVWLDPRLIDTAQVSIVSALPPDYEADEVIPATYRQALHFNTAGHGRIEFHRPLMGHQYGVSVTGLSELTSQEP